MSAVTVFNHATPLSYYNSTYATTYTSSDNFLSGEFMDPILAQIHSDPAISQEEKNLVAQLIGSPTVTIELEPIVDQLLAGTYEGHPYAYFYHFLKSLCWFFPSENRLAGTEELADLAIASLDESIRLNPEFQQSRLMRGYAKIIQSNFLDLDLAIDDFIAAARLGSKEAIEILDSLEVSWK